MNWVRVSHRSKCPICNHDTWCSFKGDDQIKCMRVESDTPTKDGGWMHPVGEQAQNRVKTFAGSRVQRFDVDCDSMLRRWKSEQNGQLQGFAATLDVSRESLNALGCVYAPEHRAFAFPMYDERRHVVGIRLRNDTGRKWAVEGSRHGVFMPPESRKDILVIVEGPTDAAAALDLGCDVIGRPASKGCEAMIRHIAARKIARVFIVQERDSRWKTMPDGRQQFLEPGKQGAERLHEYLTRAQIITLPAKDLRAYKQMGATATVFRQYLQCQCN